MLAYVFRHWPKLTVSQPVYERALLDFHQQLGAASTVFRIAHAPWLPVGRTGYEDWYLLEDSAAIDPLNDAAVSGERKSPHDQAAAMAQTGIGSLYRLVQGTAELHAARFAFWFPKPKGMPYEDLYAVTEPLTRRGGVSLWRRQMVLGPPPEFGLLAPGAIQLPPPLAGVFVRLEVISWLR